MSTVRVVETTYVGTSAGEQRLTVGQRYDSKHPLVKAYPHLFSAPEPEPEPQRAPSRRRNA